MNMPIIFASLLAAAEKDLVIPPAGGVLIEWPPHTVIGAMTTTALFGLLGVVLAITGFKLFDWVTPGNLQKEVFEKNNVSAAILGAAVILGICLIIAAAIHS